MQEFHRFCDFIVREIQRHQYAFLKIDIQMTEPFHYFVCKANKIGVGSLQFFVFRQPQRIQDRRFQQLRAVRQPFVFIIDIIKL
jgi:hypothetical protein